MQRGGGVPGASPPPGRGLAQAPHVMRVTRVPRGARGGCTAGLRIPPSLPDRWLCIWGFGRLRTRRRQRVTLYSNRGPGVSRGWSLLEHKGPGAAAAALPLHPPTPAPLVETSLPGTLSGFGVQKGRQRSGGQLPPTLPGCRGRRPSTRGRSLVRTCPTPSGMEAARLDLRRLRHLAAYFKNTPSPSHTHIYTHPSNSAGALPDSPALYPNLREPASASQPSLRIIC